MRFETVFTKTTAFTNMKVVKSVKKIQCDAQTGGYRAGRDETE